MQVFRSVLASTLCAVLAFAGAAQAETPRLRIEGSTTLLPAVQRLAENYREDHSSRVTEIHGGGSAAGINALVGGEAEIAISSRFLTTEELQRAIGGGTYPVPFRIAHDAVIPIVHKKNRIRSLSLEQLGQIFSGEITNWKQLGGPDRSVRLVLRDAGSGTHMVWSQFVVSPGEEVGIQTEVISGSEVVRYVADHRGAIGYIGLGNLNAAVRPLSVDGVMGSIKNVRSGAYPLSRSLFMFTNGWPDGVSLEFIDYVLDPERGQRVINRAGLIPVFELPEH